MVSQPPLSRRPPKPISSGNNRATSRARRQPRTRSTPKLHRPRPRSRQRWLRRHTTKPSPRCPRRRRPSPIRPSRMNWRSPDLGTTLLSRTAFDGKTISARDAAVGGGFDGVDNDDPRRTAWSPVLDSIDRRSGGRCRSRNDAPTKFPVTKWPPAGTVISRTPTRLRARPLSPVG